MKPNLTIVLSFEGDVWCASIADYCTAVHGFGPSPNAALEDLAWQNTVKDMTHMARENQEKDELLAELASGNF